MLQRMLAEKPKQTYYTGLYPRQMEEFRKVKGVGNGKEKI